MLLFKQMTSATTIVREMKTIKNFLGVYTYDTLPSPLLSECTFIMSLDSSNGDWSHSKTSIGTHWVAGLVTKGMILYQGMYAQPAPEYNLEKWKQQFGAENCYYVNVYSERLNADNCGILAMSFVKQAQKGLTSLEAFLKHTALKSDEPKM